MIVIILPAGFPAATRWPKLRRARSTQNGLRTDNVLIMSPSSMETEYQSYDDNTPGIIGTIITYYSASFADSVNFVRFYTAYIC